MKSIKLKLRVCIFCLVMDKQTNFVFTDKKIETAVKDVANQIGGDTKSTESELLTKLLNPVETLAPRTLM